MIEGQDGVTWPQWLALAQACESHGIPALFRSDHHLNLGGQSERGSLDAWATIAALAARTTTLRLGTLVSPATFRTPPTWPRSSSPPTTYRAGASSSASGRAGTSASTRRTASRSRR